ncbi:MAG: SCP-like extracellular [Sphingomonas sanxanigenens]|uniref:SCP-like extracellular n=1 Tax=Sphingomonas sanxanigenens TaxID=397260 RepID=A0A2W5CAA2_9SPHN|nr:MAG: SCP-like extracellular [Sphingomonas sanxanigenens]
MAHGAKRLLILLAAFPFVTGSVGQSTNFDVRLLAAQNRERSTLGLDRLEWDEGLAADARQWAKALAATNSFEHSRDDPDDPDPQGENLWAGTPGAFGPEQMVGLWVAEKKNYRPGRIPNVSRTGDFEDVGHYTQIVWRDTHRVGCALARGAEEDVLVCRYSSGGNVIGEKAY